MTDQHSTSTDAARLLRLLATHFVFRDWNYTRLTDIDHIRYRTVHPGQHLHERIAAAAGALLRRKTYGAPWWRLDIRFACARSALRRDPNRPDGVLDGGTIITFWEETGEYLQLVQPSVGALLADWLLAEPDNEHAQAILTELNRLRDNYGTRINAGDVDGRPRPGHDPA